MTAKKSKEPEKPVLYTDAYYAKDGYRTKQYRVKLNLSRKFAPLQKDYDFNEFPNRRKRRQIAKTKGVFKLGIWSQVSKKLENRQTYIKEPVQA